MRVGLVLSLSLVASPLHADFFVTHPCNPLGTCATVSVTAQQLANGNWSIYMLVENQGDTGRMFQEVALANLPPGSHLVGQQAWITGPGWRHFQGQMVDGSQDLQGGWRGSWFIRGAVLYHFTVSDWTPVNADVVLTGRDLRNQTTATPEPVSMTLLATGLAGVGLARRRRLR